MHLCQKFLFSITNVCSLTFNCISYNVAILHEVKCERNKHQDVCSTCNSINEENKGGKDILEEEIRHLQENVKRTEINEHFEWKLLDLFLIINIGSMHKKSMSIDHKHISFFCGFDKNRSIGSVILPPVIKNLLIISFHWHVV